MPSQSNASQGSTADAESVDQMLDMGEQKIRVLGGSTDTSAAFQIDKEGHTLGNALRYMIMKKHVFPKVEFCGYTIPHPSEDRINIRIQTADDYSAYEALEKGFDDLMDLCDVVTETFTAARNEYDEQAKS